MHKRTEYCGNEKDKEKRMKDVMRSLFPNDDDDVDRNEGSQQRPSDDAMTTTDSQVESIGVETDAHASSCGAAKQWTESEKCIYSQMCNLLDYTLHLTENTVTMVQSLTQDEEYSVESEESETKDKYYEYETLFCAEEQVIFLQNRLRFRDEENKMLKRTIANLHCRLSEFFDLYASNTESDSLHKCNYDHLQELIDTKCSLARALSEVEEEKLKRYKVMKAVDKLL